MAEVFPKDVLLRVGGRTMARHGVWAVAGSRRGLVEVPITFSRADATNCATYVDRGGVLRVAAANVPRGEWWDLDGDGIKEPYYLHEGSARTNLALRSEEIDNAVWTKANTTATANAIAAPDSVISADQVLETAVNNSHYIYETGLTITSGEVVAGSVFVKNGGRFRGRLYIGDIAGTNFFRADFNLNTGTVTTAVQGASTQLYGRIVALVDINGLSTGWYRIEIAGNINGGVTSGHLQVNIFDDTGATGYLGDVTKGLYIWGAQFERGAAFCSSYTKSVASAITRAADSFTVPCNFGQLAMSVLARFGERGSAVSNSAAGPIAFGSGSTPFSRFDTFGTAYRFSNQQVAGAVASSAASAPAISQETKLLGAIFPDGSVKTYQSIAGGADSGGAQSGVQALIAGGLWSTQNLTVGGGGWHGLVGDLLTVRDARSLAEMIAVP